MELVKTFLEIDLKNALSPWLEMRDFLRAAGENPDAELQGPPLVVELQEKKERIEIHVKKLIFIKEGLLNLEQSNELIFKKVTELNKIVKFSKYDRLISVAQFIDPYALRFNELFSLIKHKIVKEIPATESITDFGIVFDQVDGAVFKHTQFGPMGKEQLQKMYLHFERKPVPDNFVFIEERYDLGEDGEYSPERLSEFLSASMKWQIEHSGELFKYLREGM